MTLNCFSDKLNKQKLFAETLLKEFFSKKETFYLHGFTIKIKQTSDLIFLPRESWKKSSGRKKSHSSTQRIILHWFTQQQNKVVKSRQTNLRNKEMCWDCWRMLEVESDKELLSCNTIVARVATLHNIYTLYTLPTNYLHTIYTISTHYLHTHRLWGAHCWRRACRCHWWTLRRDSRSAWWSPRSLADTETRKKISTTY